MSISQAIVAINTYLVATAPHHPATSRAVELLLHARDALQRQREALQLLESQIHGDYMLLDQDGAWHLVDEDAESIAVSDTLEGLLDALYDIKHPKAGEP